MKRGQKWYKREPVSFLGGVHGLTAKELAIYTVCLELIYIHGGAVDNNPKMIGGYVADLGTAAVRNTIKELIFKGKLQETKSGQLTNARAKREAQNGG